MAEPVYCALDAVEYVLDTFDHVMVPTIHADSLLKVEIRKRILRKLVGELALSQMQLVPITNTNALIALAEQCFMLAGLMP